MAKIIKLRPEKNLTDRLIDHLFQVLPAKSHAEIAERMSLLIGRDFTEARSQTLVSHLRCHPEYGWTIPHVARGRNSSGNDRFFHVLAERGRDPEFDDEHSDELHRGAKSTVSHVASSLNNETQAVELSIQYMHGIGEKRAARALVKQMRRVVEDAHELLAALDDDEE